MGVSDTKTMDIEGAHQPIVHSKTIDMDQKTPISFRLVESALVASIIADIVGKLPPQTPIPATVVQVRLDNGPDRQPALVSGPSVTHSPNVVHKSSAKSDEVIASKSLTMSNPSSVLNKK